MEKNFLYISYSLNDLMIVLPIIKELNNRYKIWFRDATNVDIKEIITKIKESDAFIFIASNDSIIDSLCQKEINFAIKTNKPFGYIGIDPLLNDEFQFEYSIYPSVDISEYEDLGEALDYFHQQAAFLSSDDDENEEEDEEFADVEVNVMPTPIVRRKITTAPLAENINEEAKENVEAKKEEPKEVVKEEVKEETKKKLDFKPPLPIIKNLEYADSLFDEHNYSSAYELYIICYNICHKELRHNSDDINYLKSIIHILNKLTVIVDESDDIAKDIEFNISLFNYLKDLYKIENNYENYLKIYDVTATIGNFYRKELNSENALIYYLKAFDIAKKTYERHKNNQNLRRLIVIYSKLGPCYSGVRKEKEAYEMTLEGYELAKRYDEIVDNDDSKEILSNYEIIIEKIKAELYTDSDFPGIYLAPSEINAKKYKEYIASAIKAYEEFDINKAITDLEYALVIGKSITRNRNNSFIDPNENGLYAFKLAVLYLKEHRYDNAINLLSYSKRIVSSDSYNNLYQLLLIKIAKNLGIAYFNEGLYDKALPEFISFYDSSKRAYSSPTSITEYTLQDIFYASFYLGRLSLINNKEKNAKKYFKEAYLAAKDAKYKDLLYLQTLDTFYEELIRQPKLFKSSEIIKFSKAQKENLVKIKKAEATKNLNDYDEFYIEKIK